MRSKRNASHRILFASGVLIASLGTVKFLDLNATTQDPQRAPGSLQAVSQVLALPDASVHASSASHEQTAGRSASVMVPPQLPPLALLTTSATPAAAQQATVAPQLPGKPQQATTAAPSLLSQIEHAPAAQRASITVESEIPALEASSADIAPADTITPAVQRWTEHTVVSGDSLARIFDAQGLEPALLHRIVNSADEAKALARIRPGQTFRFEFDENNELSALELRRSRIDSIRVAIQDDQIDVEEISKAVDKQVASAAGLIESSLFTDGQKAGLSDAKIMELAGIFGWDIDFALEIRAGDHFRVLYEEQFLDGEKLRDGPILAAEFTNRGKTFRAVRYEGLNGETGYFDDEGHSKRRAFLRTPIKFARISSRFNPRRWHPLLKKWRSHKGVDYAAPTGTPIKASGDGRVVHRGTKGGYGRTVILQHAGKYTTLYAHLSKYSKRAKVGARVKQGQVIGYVGKSGLASGPHLHYEFRVNGVHKDPLRVKLPKSLALPKSEIASFKKTTRPLLAQLDAVSAATMVARVETHSSN